MNKSLMILMIAMVLLTPNTIISTDTNSDAVSTMMPIGSVAAMNELGDEITYTHTVTYDGNGNTDGRVRDTVVTDNNSGNSSVTLSNNIFIKQGYHFTGWMIDTEIYQPGDDISVAGNTSATAYAQWEMGRDTNIYTNMGAYYYEKINDQVTEHISVTMNGKTCIISSSDEWTKNLTAGSYWTVPLFTTALNNEVYYLECCPQIPAPNTMNTFEWKVRLQPGNIDVGFNLEIWGNRNAYIYKGSDILFDDQIDLLMCGGYGEFVYTKRPIVAPTSDIILVGGMGKTTGTAISGWYIYGGSYSSTGTMNQIKNNLSGNGTQQYILTQYKNYPDTDTMLRTYTMVENSQTISDFQTAENNYGHRIDGITIESKWEYNGDQRTMKITLDSAIVPTTVPIENNGSDNENTPTFTAPNTVLIMFAIGIPLAVVIAMVYVFKK